VDTGNSGGTSDTPATLDDLRRYRAALDSNQIANLASKATPTPSTPAPPR